MPTKVNIATLVPGMVVHRNIDVGSLILKKNLPLPLVLNFLTSNWKIFLLSRTENSVISAFCIHSHYNVVVLNIHSLLQQLLSNSHQLLKRNACVKRSIIVHPKSWHMHYACHAYFLKSKIPTSSTCWTISCKKTSH